MMTAKMKELYDFIVERIKETDVPPSYQEMNDHLGLHSKSGVHRLIKALGERGLIRRLPNRARAIEVVALRREMKVVPLRFVPPNEMSEADILAEKRALRARIDALTNEEIRRAVEIQRRAPAPVEVEAA